MGQITLKQKNKIYYINNSLEKTESVNEWIAKKLSAGQYNQFFPIQVEQIKNRYSLSVSVEGYVPLSVVLNNNTSNNLFLDIVLQIINIVKFCEQNMLNPDFIDLRTETIFYNPVNRNIRCIYWPLVNSTYSILPADFFKNLPNSVNKKFLSNAYVFEPYTKFFSSIEPFSINNFEKLIKRLNGDTHFEINAPQDSTNSSRLGKKSVEKDIEYNPLLCVPKEVAQPKFSYLIHKNLNIKICVNAQNFIIGKSQQGVNYQVKNNNAVSRTHAMIITNERGFFLRDLGSSNHTYVNNSIINPNIDIKLENNSIIRLANEEFIFVLE